VERHVIKIGGSLMTQVPPIINALRDARVRALIVPGGGIFADVVRLIDSKFLLSPSISHWMAVAAMEQYGYFLSDVGGLKTTKTPRFDGLFVLLPYEFLSRGDIELPDQSWATTSDTISAIIAHKWNARLYKVTDVDGVFVDGKLMRVVDASTLLSRKTCIDDNLPHFLIHKKMDCIVVNGNFPERVVKSIKSGEIEGTLIRGR